MPATRAIQTSYGDCRFRSRAEARWAVFFDRLDVPWDYEPEGFELPSGRYLPDFFLPATKGGTYFEVKGQKPDDAELTKARELCAASGKRVLIAVRAPLAPDGMSAFAESMVAFLPGPHRTDSGEMIVSEDWDYWWCECARCGAVGVEHTGRSARLGCFCYDPSDDKQFNYMSDRLMAAYAAARSARFGT